MKDYIVKEDMICPSTGLHCDDECCPVGSVCNLCGEDAENNFDEERYYERLMQSEPQAEERDRMIEAQKLK
jgi:hypothetical protein